jgi:Entner-Doudoroff aldolase
MDQDALLRRFAEERCSAILRIDDFGLARDAMEAAVRGGFKIIEFTLTIPGALSLVKEFSARGDLLVGAGTVMQPDQARAAVKAGARFLVSPVMDPDMIRLARELGALSIPGTSTPTEMWLAVKAGAPVVKLFPSAEKGPSFVRACLGPMPDLRIFPTSGVTEENAAEYLGAGAFGVGFVASLFDAAELRGRALDRIEARARRMVEVVRRCR